MGIEGNMGVEKGKNWGEEEENWGEEERAAMSSQLVSRSLALRASCNLLLNVIAPRSRRMSSLQL